MGFYLDWNNHTIPGIVKLGKLNAYLQKVGTNYVFERILYYAKEK
jgi:hypothetical protein